jgi:hypothetical protein
MASELGGKLMVATFNCYPSADMIWTNDGNYVQLADYEKLRESLRACAEAMANWVNMDQGRVNEVGQVAQDAFNLLEES